MRPTTSRAFPTVRGFKLPVARAATPSSTTMTIDELAERWRVDRKSLYEMVRSGDLPVIRIGRLVRVSLRTVESLEQPGVAPLTEK